MLSHGRTSQKDSRRIYYIAYSRQRHSPHAWILRCSNTPVAASSVRFPIQRPHVFFEGAVAVAADCGVPVPIRLVYRTALVAPAHGDVHQRVEKLEASRVLRSRGALFRIILINSWVARSRFVPTTPRRRCLIHVDAGRRQTFLKTFRSVSAAFRAVAESVAGRGEEPAGGRRHARPAASLPLPLRRDPAADPPPSWSGA